MFLNVKNAKQGNFDRILWNIDNMSPWKYFINISGYVTLLFPRNRRLTELSTELKNWSDSTEVMSSGDEIFTSPSHRHCYLINPCNIQGESFCFKIHETEIAKTIWLPINSHILFFSIFNQQKSQTGIMFASKTETPTAGLCTLYWSREVLHIYPKFTMKSKDCSRQTIHPSIPTHVDICLWALHPVLQLQEPTNHSLTSSHQFQTFLIYACVVLIVYNVRFRRHYRCQDSGS